MDLNVWSILDVRVVIDHITIHLDVNDIASLVSTCKTLRDMNSDDYLWNSFFRSHGFTMKNAVKSIHLSLNECGYKHNYQEEVSSVICGNAPVYVWSKCVVCTDRKKICKSCRRKEYIDTTYCQICENYTGVCIDCRNQDNFQEDDILIHELKECIQCHLRGCYSHFHNFPRCDSCHAKRPKKKRKNKRFKLNRVSHK